MLIAYDPKDEMVLREKLAAKLVGLVRKHAMDNSRELIVRSINPKEDLSMKTVQWEFPVKKGEWNPIVGIDATLNFHNERDYPRAIGFYGVESREYMPLTTMIKFTLGSEGVQVKEIWHLESAFCRNSAMRQVVYFGKNYQALICPQCKANLTSVPSIQNPSKCPFCDALVIGNGELEINARVLGYYSALADIALWYEPHSTFTISVYGRETGIDNLIIKGLVVERRGLNTMALPYGL